MRFTVSPVNYDQKPIVTQQYSTVPQARIHGAASQAPYVISEPSGAVVEVHSPNYHWPPRLKGRCPHCPF